jgi:hypothetical protein
MEDFKLIFPITIGYEWMSGLNSNKTLNRQNIESSFPWFILLQLIYLNYDVAGKGQNPPTNRTPKVVGKVILPMESDLITMSKVNF